MYASTRKAHEDLIRGVYPRLRDIAAGYLARERVGHTLQATALVHEAVIRLNQHGLPPGIERSDILGLAATTMRLVLVDHARRKRAGKRGGRLIRQPLDDTLAAYEASAIDLIALHDALEQLACCDARMARIVDLKFFAGLNEEETADVLGVSVATVRRQWRLARNWLHHHLRGTEGDDR